MRETGNVILREETGERGSLGLRGLAGSTSDSEVAEELPCTVSCNPANLVVIFPIWELAKPLPHADPP